MVYQGIGGFYLLSVESPWTSLNHPQCVCTTAELGRRPGRQGKKRERRIRLILVGISPERARELGAGDPASTFIQDYGRINMLTVILPPPPSKELQYAKPAQQSHSVFVTKISTAWLFSPTALLASLASVIEKYPGADPGVNADITAKVFITPSFCMWIPKAALPWLPHHLRTMEYAVSFHIPKGPPFQALRLANTVLEFFYTQYHSEQPLDFPQIEAAAYSIQNNCAQTRRIPYFYKQVLLRLSHYICPFPLP
ncbi:hypothetical protein DFP72DRAFT_861399 [Ephemerocybe angulata]|uniref:Uncharacterized protein n=1 Tax=Ephemerocybe angulata TaxID=980116 RepID=A0A8H6LV23_9AGAR|nr:hypothetical protein DFP72DRAFT_861399 [Tulosesus angulatus]